MNPLRRLAGIIQKALTPTQPFSSFGNWGAGWWPVIREPYRGAWQHGMELRHENLLAYHAVYSCITLIAADIAKMRIRLMDQDANGIWSEATAAAFSPVLRKPNRYQNRVQFYQQWVVSKLINGNTYVLKERDNRGVVSAMYVLDPNRVRVLIAPDGEIFYNLSADYLADIPVQIEVPASEIIHDVMTPLYHPLCGISPLTACLLAASQGMAIQRESAGFFANRSLPGGVVTSPQPITDEQARAMATRWKENYSGTNTGKVAVLGNGLEFKAISVTAEDAQLIEQLKWTAETVCSCFHVPAYMIGVGAPPIQNNIEALSQQYYSQCLQTHIESIEICLDEGLGLPDVPGHYYGTCFDLDDLLRMDTATRVRTVIEGLKGIYTPNEARVMFDLKPVPGGDAVYLQQQNFSTEALNKRDSKADPFGGTPPAKPAAPPADGNQDGSTANDNTAQQAALALEIIRMGLPA
jgi:HK97 family phage portal protein